MIFSSMRRIAVAAALVTAVGLLSIAATASATGASQPQRRQLAATTLTYFKVILTATRGGPGHPQSATVTAAGYRRSDSHWKLIATKRIGKANGWLWGDVDTCSLTTTQFQANPSPPPPVSTLDSIKVSLLLGPALGCSRTYSKRWMP